MATQSSPSHGMALLVSYHQNPSIAVRNQIVRLNLGLVRKIAYRVSHQCAEPYEDLEQIGYVGLIRAIERFDPTHGCAFSSFAVPYIRGEILHFLRDRSSTIKIPRRWQELQKQGQRAREALAQTLGHQPNDREIAQAIGISLTEWQDIRLAGQNRSLLSLDAVVNHQIDSTVTIGETLTDTRTQMLQVSEDERHQLQAALSQLESKTRAAIEFVYYDDLSRKEVSERMGVSPMTVTRRIQRGVQQMAMLLQPQTTGSESEVQTSGSSL